MARYFYTKMCTVEPACQDTSDARMEDMGMDVTCAEVEGRCDASDSEDATFLPYLCPVACGVCAAAPEDSDPAGYVVDAIRYHGHLLGREMYTTLLPNQRRATPVDLESKDLWIYDFQVTYPFRDEEGEPASVTVYPGDQIQTTCVYDSTAREEATPFYLSTYDEMCITQLNVLVDTPAVGADDGASLLAQLNARSFNCAVDDSSAIWGGSLALAEDGRDVWKDHPMLEADCTFPVGVVDGGGGLSLIGDAAPTFESLCSSDGDYGYGYDGDAPCDFCSGGEHVQLVSQAGVSAMECHALRCSPMLPDGNTKYRRRIPWDLVRFKHRSRPRGWTSGLPG